MRTIAIAASIALITGGGVAGILVGGKGAQVARDLTSTSMIQPSAGTTTMRRPVRTEAQSDVQPPATDSTPAVLRSGDDSVAPRTPPVSIDLNAVFPEDHAAPPRIVPAPAVTTGQVRTLTRPAQRVVPAQTARAPARQPAPTRVVSTTPPPRTQPTLPAALAAPQQHAVTTTPQPRANRRAPVQRATAPRRAPARTAALPVHTAPPPQAPSVAPVTTTQAVTPPALDATRRTTMSQGEPPASGSTSEAPSAPAPTPLASAPPPATESPAALLANP